MLSLNKLLLQISIDDNIDVSNLGGYMMIKNITFAISALIMFSFLLVALPQTSISSVPQGCCINPVSDTCFGCIGGGCATQEEYCIDNGGNPAAEGICFDGLAGASCQGTEFETGCCVVEPGDCLEDEGSRSCFDGEHGIFWHPGQACEEVAQCSAPRDIPTLSEWGLIAMAGVLGIIGFMVMRRRKVSA